MNSSKSGAPFTNSDNQDSAVKRVECAVKADPRPTTQQWYETTLKIKEFCESRELQVSDTAYGWLSTFFYELALDSTRLTTKESSPLQNKGDTASH